MRSLALLLLVLLTGCTHAARTTGPAAQPASLAPVPGSSLHSVVLTEQAAGRLGVRTQPLEDQRIPTSAVVYDPRGQSWAYTLVGPLTYLRSPIAIARVEGSTAVLRSGPPHGTPVVVAGVQELLGAEYGVGEE